MRENYPLNELPFNPFFTALANQTALASNFFPSIVPLEERIGQACSSLARTVNKEQREKLFLLLKEAHPLSQDSKVKEMLELTLESNSFFIVSGQQAGILGGPLLTLIKLCALIALSERLNKALPKYNFIPLFWVSGTDHDFDEIRHIHYVGEEGRLRTVSLEQPRESIGFPISRIIIGKNDEVSIRKALEEMGAQDSKIQKIAESSYQEKLSYTSAFIKLYANLLGERQVLFIDPEADAAKATASKLFYDSITHFKDEIEIIAETAERIRRLKLAPQVPPMPIDTNLFILDDEGIRRKIMISDDCFSLKARSSGEKKQTKFTSQALLRLLETEPHRFSPNVLLRPLYQQVLIPTCAYIGGPAEVSYWAQSYPLFDLYSLPRPILLPRPTLSLISARHKRDMEKLNLELTSFLKPIHTLLPELIKGLLPASLQEEIERFRNKFLEHSQKIKQEALRIEPNLENSIDRLSLGFERYLHKVENRITRSIKQKNELLVRQVESLYDWLMPMGNLQERTLAGLFFILSFGEAVIERIVSNCSFPAKEHLVIVL